MRKRSLKKQFVVCIKNRGYRASLVVRRIYPCIPDPEATKRGLLRVVDESGEDYLYPATLFVAVDLPASVGRAFLLAS
jgi:hypothetical protein